MSPSLCLLSGIWPQQMLKVHIAKWTKTYLIIDMTQFKVGESSQQVLDHKVGCSFRRQGPAGHLDDRLADYVQRARNEAENQGRSTNRVESSMETWKKSENGMSCEH